MFEVEIEEKQRTVVVKVVVAVVERVATVVDVEQGDVAESRAAPVEWPKNCSSPLPQLLNKSSPTWMLL